jgi:hypothetical protein
VSKKIPAVRILPMSPNQKSFRGRSLEDVQQEFFLKELPSPPKNGRFRYPTSGLSAERGTMVLFQYEGRIIASAILDRKERFERPQHGYKGALWFDPKSIRTFQPVGPDEVRAIWPEFRRFGHVKQYLDPANYPAFEKQLIGVATPAESSRGAIALPDEQGYPAALFGKPLVKLRS